ncbi:LOW QUALITY PROTEIN: uncharacterized protein LOC133194482 [Saccostrea echinata]|uniref:LOW QUALITY PROTEIN: uncharacterized protein LOC133194482 n=1 Tax=Saccostrea echinata TaxID=191078 RepID=UPI002A8349AC|nr:LOW QUALITY PROTEIN: uncharacterized protein LOC133194482 [Saccostrea echinata]
MKLSFTHASEAAVNFFSPACKIYGGSMISPVTFVNHWHIKASLEFQQEKNLLMITKSEFRMELNITKDFIHDYVTIDMQNSYTFLYFNVRSSPKLFKDKYFHKLDDEPRPVRIPASKAGFSKFGYLDCFSLKLRTDCLVMARIIWYIQYRGIHIVYARMKVENPKEEIKPYFRDFELEYAWKSLFSMGYKVMDHITREIIHELYQRKVTAQVLFKMMENVAEKPFFHFIEQVNAAMKMIDHESPDNGADNLQNYSMVRRVLLTPTKFIFMPKEPVFQNRIFRQYNEDFFVRLVYRDDNFEKISSMQSSTLSDVLVDMKRIFVDGFTIYDRHYSFLGCSNSQLREYSFWFFSSYGGITTESIRQNAGDLYKERCVASYVSRFGLCFSSSFHTLNIGENAEEVHYESDVKRNGFCFTDGIGKISTKLAAKVAKVMRQKAVPSAFQIRYGGCKGVVAQDPSLGTEREVLVIRESMKKFESSSTSLEVLQVSRPGRLHLNRQVITLLSGLGIPDEIFQELQETMIFDLADMFLHDDKALSSLQELSLATDFKRLLDKKVSIVREPFLRSLLLAIFEQRVDDLKKRSRIQIPLDKGRYMMGTSDETQSLKYGQVFIQYSKEINQPVKDVQIVQGKVVVTKNPCFHPGDLRVFEAVYIPALKHMVDCIVFPQLGSRPHPDEMSGSDLDGDEYFVCWDERFHRIENRDPMDFPKAEKIFLDSDVQLTHIVDFLANYIKNDNLGIIANAHLAMADSEQEGIFSVSCLELAQKHSDAVDFPKTGIFAQMDTDIRPQKYPDFMMKIDKLPYYSPKVLGKLYRQCTQLHQVTQRENAFRIDFQIDDDFVSSLTTKETEDGNLQRNLYNNKLIDIMNEYGLKTESGAISGIIQTLRHKRGFLKDEKFQIGKIVREKVSMLFKRTRAIFFEEFGGEEMKNESLEQMIRKASAWYTVTYKNQTRSSRLLLSFPWIVADILSLKKYEQIQINSLKRIELSLEKRMKQSEKDRMKGLSAYNVCVQLVEQNIPRNLHLEWLALSGNGIVLPGDHNQYLGMTRGDLKPIISTIQRLSNSTIPIEIDTFSGKLCFPFKLEDGMDGLIIIITDDMIINKSKIVNKVLEKYSFLTSDVQFLTEEFRESLTVETSGHEEKEQFITSESMLLPIESRSAIEFATPYVEFKLKEKTGADIFIYSVEFKKFMALKLEAIGTNLQLEQVYKALYDMSTNSIAKGITYAKFGQTMHHIEKPKYLPILESHSGTNDGNNFQKAFHSQWRKIRNDYRDVFHGDLGIALVFGAFYVMDINENHTTVSELNDHLRNFEERRCRGYKMGCVPYSFSFLPMYKQTGDLKTILKTNFVKINTQRTVKVRIGNEGLFDFDEHLNILRYNAPEIKWFLGQIIRLHSPDNSHAEYGARCKILSNRNLTKKTFMEMKGNEWLQHSTRPLIQRTGDDFSVRSDRVTYIREKETAIYSNVDLKLENKVWRTMQIEVCRVKEYDIDQLTHRSKKISERTELAIIPYIPDIRSSDDEINKYSDQLWEIALYFGRKI